MAKIATFIFGLVLGAAAFVLFLKLTSRNVYTFSVSMDDWIGDKA